MKKPYFIVLPLLLIVVAWFVLAKHNKVKAVKGCSMDEIMNDKVDTSAYSKLTAQERKDYTITIEQSKIEVPHDTLINDEWVNGNRLNGKYPFVNIPVTLTNHSDHPLKYIMWTCGWDDEFCISNNDVETLGWSCQANFPDEVTLAVNSDTVYILPVITAKKYTKGERFKIAMSLFISDGDGRNECALLGLSSFKGKNLIWSNEVFLP